MSAVLECGTGNIGRVLEIEAGELHEADQMLGEPSRPKATPIHFEMGASNIYASKLERIFNPISTRSTSWERASDSDVVQCHIQLPPSVRGFAP
jgi:hypothetical protein